MSNKRDYYEILGVSKTASQQEIKSAYRKLAKKYHPDVLKDGTSDQKMKEINEAYSVLSDETKRKNYDQFGTEGPAGGGYGQGFQDFGGFQDIFENIFSGFGGFGGGRNRAKKYPQRGEDYQTVYEISFSEAIKGVELERDFTKFELCLHCNGKGAESPSDIQQCQKCHGKGYEQKVVNSIFGQTMTNVECSNCHGTGEIITKKCSQCNGQKYIKVQKRTKINIPAGASNSTRLKLAGYGGPGELGGPSGDLYIVIRVRPHEFFEREGNNIFIQIPVSYIDLALEKTILIPTPYGPEKVKLKKHYQNGQLVKLKGKGVRTSRETGDLYFKISVIVPDYSRKERKELEALFAKIDDTTNNDFVKKVEQAK
ncbi:molecular chaperone DnaJ [Mycoplasmopsis gallopavonis]|uniref:Chaperone protein DnaJ n=1 Tax=Mycoplasmopsis gallopavonis TaxID=76629 RepID=A0A449AZK7_9BACT|nr:molecular chaperone DnaJ [Mycoplasmopsis gallopavonis]RIV16328.1 molecular chaperone DnaJ [Mycoplasmopsis gallopavonis]VEU72927.1 Heat shock protein DnaJ [Mycoplasmopsis gallopavonis]